jgi:predicted DNA-binding transcriptional regulator YafY
LSFGGGVRVVSPPSLQEAVRQAAERIVRGSADLKAPG